MTNYTEKVFIDMISAHLSGTTYYDFDIEKIDCEYFKKLATTHKVGGIIYSYIKDSNIDEKEKNFYQLGLLTEIDAYTKRQRALSSLIKILGDSNIYHVMIKGSFIANLYPIPEFRTMSDLDILIDCNDRERVKDIMLSNGAKFREEVSDEGVDVYKFLDVNIEMHVSLVSDRLLMNKVDYISYFANAFDKKIVVKEHSCMLDWECCLIYTLFHIAKHFYNSGCGVRMLMDIPILIKNMDNPNWEIIWAELEKIKLKGFAIRIFQICEKWFGSMNIKYPKDIKDESNICMVEEFILGGGVYGFHGRNTSAYAVQRNTRNKSDNSNYLVGMIRWAFPSYSEMRRISPWFKSKPAFLLPVAYVERFLRNAKERGGAVKWLKKIVLGKKDLDDKQKILSIMYLE